MTISASVLTAHEYLVLKRPSVIFARHFKFELLSFPDHSLGFSGSCLIDS